MILKGLTMGMSIIALALTTAAVANGQGNMRAQIPFDFSIANKDFRAGEYHVRRMNDAGDAVLIGSADARAQLVVLTGRAGSAREDENTQSKLVFHRYGNQYFLSQIWTPGSGRELPMSKRERAIQRELKGVAANRGTNNPVYEVVEVFTTGR
jgi:hypothetical protein